jgi:hypothetical protein
MFLLKVSKRELAVSRISSLLREASAAVLKTSSPLRLATSFFRSWTQLPNCFEIEADTYSNWSAMAFSKALLDFKYEKTDMTAKQMRVAVTVGNRNLFFKLSFIQYSFKL